MKLAIYGPNVLSTTGDVWRLHRRITSRSFSLRNAQVVHAETIRQTTQMLESWDQQAKNGQLYIEE